MEKKLKGNNFKCSKGLLEIAFGNTSILLQATKVYTITLCEVFKE